MRPLVEAATYARRYPTLGVIILVSVAPGAIGLSYMFLLPVVIRDLGANPGTIGLLYVGGGIGGLLAGLAAEPLMRSVGHGRTIFVGMGLIGAGPDRRRAVGGLVLAAVAIGVAQAGFVIYGSSSLSLVQSLSPARLRGRVTSLFTLLYWGLMPFGALAGGLIAERSSGLIALILAGSIVIGCGVRCSSSGPRSRRSGSTGSRARSPDASRAAATLARGELSRATRSRTVRGRRVGCHHATQAVSKTDRCDRPRGGPGDLLLVLISAPVAPGCFEYCELGQDFAVFGLRLVAVAWLVVWLRVAWTGAPANLPSQR